MHTRTYTHTDKRTHIRIRTHTHTLSLIFSASPLPAPLLFRSCSLSLCLYPRHFLSSPLHNNKSPFIRYVYHPSFLLIFWTKFCFVRANYWQLVLKIHPQQQTPSDTPEQKRLREFGSSLVGGALGTILSSPVRKLMIDRSCFLS